MAKQKTSNIEQIPTADLIPYARNARTHSETQVAQIAGSIQEFGFTNPVLIDADNGIIAGHGRILAAQRLKLESVPCLRLSHLTDAQKRAYVLADNRIALSSGWDEEMLANELSDLHADEFDMSLLGFDVDELATLLVIDMANADVADDAEVNESTTDDSIVMSFPVTIEQEIIFRRSVALAKNTLGADSTGDAVVKIMEAWNAKGE
jgi:ParB-like chromosome segregation protein Spo0J